MKALRRPSPSFSCAISGPMDSSSSSAPSEKPSQVLRHPPYPHSCRLVDLGDPARRTVDGRFNERTLNQTSTCDIKQDEDIAMIHLHDAIHHTAGKDCQGRSRTRRFSMTTLVIDLALAIKRKMSNFPSSKA